MKLEESLVNLAKALDKACDYVPGDLSEELMLHLRGSVEIVNRLMFKIEQYELVCKAYERSLEESMEKWMKVQGIMEDTLANISLMRETHAFEIHCRDQEIQRYKEKYGPLT